MEITTRGYCPNCDQRLTIIEDGMYYQIKDGDHTVTSCPNCLIPLRVEGGVIVEDK